MKYTPTELAELDREFAELQSNRQLVFEVVCSHSGSVVTRHFSSREATEQIQTMIDHWDALPGEYWVRERRCTLAPLRKSQRTP